MDVIVDFLSEMNTLYVDAYLGALRYAVPALVILLLLRCLGPLMFFRREPEIWAWLSLKVLSTPTKPIHSWIP